MKIALAQINTSTGNIHSNCERMSKFLELAKEKHADLTIFPELSVIGYPPKDLLEQHGFVAKSLEALERLAKDHADQHFITGFVHFNRQMGKEYFNSAAYITNGKIAFVQHKSLLPSYDVFEEARYFESGHTNDIVTIAREKVGITICEDIWTDEVFLGRKLYPRMPAQELKQKGAQIIVNISASPYHEGKEKTRYALIHKLAKELQLPFVFVNLVGGNDELLFDGGSFAVNAQGKVMAQCEVFKEDLVVVDINKDQSQIRFWPESSQEWRVKALMMGIHDYVFKCGFQRVFVGLSGGIDSALTLVLAAQAIGPNHVTAVFMPSPYTSKASYEDAQALASNLGVEFMVIPIEAIMKAYEQSWGNIFSCYSRDITEENIQARIRGNLLMALSNKLKGLVLSTGNKSELAVGYCTQYGDMVGGLAVISDLSKHQVYEVAHYLNQSLKVIPQRIFDRAPSAELRPDQKDEDSLPPYSLLDPILALYIEDHYSEKEIVARGYDKLIVKKIIALVEQNEFKRRQAALGLRLSKKAFGGGRRMPVARGAV